MLLQLLQVQPALFGSRDAMGPLKREIDRAQRFESLKVKLTSRKRFTHTVILQIFGVVLFSVISVVNGKIKKTPK